ncbi:MAG: polysaccharide pyruvyl transferase family protein [Propionibacteriaceae bacterium]|nr:polysaccharide pyruvyl transferase family protein [Propionibacteriaceae bacterium]
MNPITQWALFEYSTENIGDEIQSIAARRFLPHVDHMIDRDHLGEFRTTGEQQVGLIANAWYMHPPYAWPPRDPSVTPLLISMHIDVKDPHVERVFSSSESLAYFERFGPVGARDTSTLNFLTHHGVDTWMSRCLTLTLSRDERIPTAEYILAVDCPPDAVAALRQQTDRPIVHVSPYHMANLERDERFRLAEFLLMLYQSAHTVVASRLHAALPCLAFDTPVLLVKTDTTFDEARFDGLTELLHCSTPEEIIHGSNTYDVDHPPQNLQHYVPFRDRLVNVATSYTGYDSVATGQSIMSIDPSTWSHDATFLSMFGKFLSDSYPSFVQHFNSDALVADLRHQLTRAEASDRDLAHLQDQMAALLSSRSYRLGQALTSPIRLLRRLRARLF